MQFSFFSGSRILNIFSKRNRNHKKLNETGGSKKEKKIKTKKNEEKRPLIDDTKTPY